MKKPALACVGLMMLLSTTVVQAREQVTYDQTLKLSGQLSDAVYSDQTLPQIRNNSYHLANLLNNFVLNEAEVRAEHKVSAPSTILTRPGEAPKADLLSLPAGETVELRAVPDEWFLGKIEITRAKMRQMLKLLEQDNADPKALQILAKDIHTQLELIVRPPVL